MFSVRGGKVPSTPPACQNGQKVKIFLFILIRSPPNQHAIFQNNSKRHVTAFRFVPTNYYFETVTSPHTIAPFCIWIQMIGTGWCEVVRPLLRFFSLSMELTDEASYTAVP